MDTSTVQLLFNYGVPCVILFGLGFGAYKYIPKWMEHQFKKDDILFDKMSNSLLLIQQSNENMSNVLSLAVEEIKSTHTDIKTMDDKIDKVQNDVTDIKNKVGA